MHQHLALPVILSFLVWIFQGQDLVGSWNVTLEKCLHTERLRERERERERHTHTNTHTHMHTYTDSDTEIHKEMNYKNMYNGQTDAFSHVSCIHFHNIYISMTVCDTSLRHYESVRDYEYDQLVLMGIIINMNTINYELFTKPNHPSSIPLPSINYYKM